MKTDTHLENIRNTFNRHASPRNPDAFFSLKEKVQSVLKKYASDGNMLDLGGGDGTLTQPFTNVVLADFCPEPLHRAAAANHAAIQCDMHKLPFKSNAFALAFLCHVLQHSPSPSAALMEIKHVLRHDGILILVLPNAASVFQIYKLIRKGQVKPLGNPPLENALQCHQYTVENTIQLLSENAFHILEIRGDIISLPLLRKWKGWYSASSKLASSFPKLSDSIIVVAQNKK